MARFSRPYSLSLVLLLFRLCLLPLLLSFYLFFPPSLSMIHSRDHSSKHVTALNKCSHYVCVKRKSNTREISVHCIAASRGVRSLSSAELPSYNLLLAYHNNSLIRNVSRLNPFASDSLLSDNHHPITPTPTPTPTHYQYTHNTYHDDDSH